MDDFSGMLESALLGLESEAGIETVSSSTIPASVLALLMLAKVIGLRLMNTTEENRHMIFSKMQEAALNLKFPLDNNMVENVKEINTLSLVSLKSADCSNLNIGEKVRYITSSLLNSRESSYLNQLKEKAKGQIVSMKQELVTLIRTLFKGILFDVYCAKSQFPSGYEKETEMKYSDETMREIRSRILDILEESSNELKSRAEDELDTPSERRRYKRDLESQISAAVDGLLVKYQYLNNGDAAREIRKSLAERYPWMDVLVIVYNDVWGWRKHCHWSWTGGIRVTKLHWRNKRCIGVFLRDKADKRCEEARQVEEVLAEAATEYADFEYNNYHAEAVTALGLTFHRNQIIEDADAARRTCKKVLGGALSWGTVVVERDNGLWYSTTDDQMMILRSGKHYNIFLLLY